MKNKLSAILLFILIVSLMCGIIVVNVTALVWDGSVSNSLNGSGTEADPYIIASGSDLAYLAAKVNGNDADIVSDNCSGIYFKQIADINLGGKEWTPIGKSNKIYFAGCYDGSGYTVDNFKVTDQNYSGLFGYMNGSAAGIKNIVISGATISGRYTGGIIAYAVGGSYVKGCVVTENCSISGTSRTGGIASTTANGSTLAYCINNAAVTGDCFTTDTFCGGIVGVNSGNSTVSYCVNNGILSIGVSTTEPSTKSGYFGGIAGAAGATTGSGNIDHCYNTGAVEVNSALPGNVYLGGITGIAARDIVAAHLIGDCFNFGTITYSSDASTVTAGAISGYVEFSELTMKNVYALDGTSTELVGTADSLIINDGTGFTERSSLELKASVVNGGLITYNVAFTQWLLNLPDPPTTQPEVTATEAPVTTTEIPDVTTAKPEDTTVAPVETTTAKTETTTAKPEITTAPDTTVTTKDKGCGGIALFVQFISLICGACSFVVIKKK